MVNRDVRFIDQVIRVKANDGFAEGDIAPNPQDVGRGMNKPRLHKIGGNHYITKHDIDSLAFEPLAHELGNQFGVKVPKTTTKYLEDRHMLTVPHSVQQYVHGLSGGEIQKQQGVKDRNIKTFPEKLTSHPDVHSMVLFDNLVGQTDRHTNNYLHDADTDQVHAIDNGLMFGGYHPAIKNDRDKTNMFEVNGSIPESFRQAILNADPRQHSAMLQRGLSKPQAQEALRMRGMPHSEVVHDEYMSRLAAYKRHMSNPNIQTIEHLRNVLYPPNS